MQIEEIKITTSVNHTRASVIVDMTITDVMEHIFTALVDIVEPSTEQIKEDIASISALKMLTLLCR